MAQAAFPALKYREKMMKKIENQDLKDHFLKKKILSPEIRISSIDVYLFT